MAKKRSQWKKDRRRSARSALERAFLRFHRDNPQVYELFKKYALRAASRKKRTGAKAVWERLRWDVEVETSSEDEFRLNNNHTAYYARMFMEDHPRYRGFFRTRRVRNEARDE